MIRFVKTFVMTTTLSVISHCWLSSI